MRLTSELKSIKKQLASLDRPYNIAIMLNGHPKHLNITSKLYSVYNNLYEALI